MRVSPIPEEFSTITPHLTVRGAAQAIAFYSAAFGARELLRNCTGDGSTVAHAELLLHHSRFFVNDEFPDRGVLAPQGGGRSPLVLHLYVSDVDAAFERALRAGATVLMPVANRPWGDRYGELQDPFGYTWSLASRLEDLSPAELTQRMDAVHGRPPEGAG